MGAAFGCRAHHYFFFSLKITGSVFSRGQLGATE